MKDKQIFRILPESLKKKLLNMKVMVIPTVRKGLENRLVDVEIRGRIEMILTTMLLNLNIYKSHGNSLSFRLQGKTTS